MRDGHISVSTLHRQSNVVLRRSLLLHYVGTIQLLICSGAVAKKQLQSTNGMFAGGFNSTLPTFQYTFYCALPFLYPQQAHSQHTELCFSLFSLCETSKEVYENSRRILYVDTTLLGLLIA